MIRLLENINPPWPTVGTPSLETIQLSNITTQVSYQIYYLNYLNFPNPLGGLKEHGL